MNPIKKLVVILVISFGLTGIVIAHQSRSAAGAGSTVAEEVKFQGMGITLSGTLLFPKSDKDKKVPGILVVGDWGETTRDGVTLGGVTQPIYKEIAAHLASKGLAVLSYDKRCAGKSECKKAETFDDIVDDARGALRYLRGRPEIADANIFIFGHGEGGIIASSIAAHRDEKVSGVILAAMAGRTIGKILRDVTQQRMTEDGKSEEDINKYLTRYDRMVRLMMSGRMKFEEEKLDPDNPYDSVIVKLIENYTVNISLLINDPLQIVNSIESPVLILQGRKDLVIAVKDAEFLYESMKRAYHPDTTLHLLDDVTHFLKYNKGEANLAADMNASLPLDTAFIKILGEWIEKRAFTVKDVK